MCVCTIVYMLCRKREDELLVALREAAVDTSRVTDCSFDAHVNQYEEDSEEYY